MNDNNILKNCIYITRNPWIAEDCPSVQPVRHHSFRNRNNHSAQVGEGSPLVLNSFAWIQPDISLMFLIFIGSVVLSIFCKSQNSRGTMKRTSELTPELTNAS